MTENARFFDSDNELSDDGAGNYTRIMRYALVHGERREATAGIIGNCDACAQEMIPVLGEQVVHHWRHRSRRDCDPWSENKTLWHRSWQDEFPIEWREVTMKDAISGARHVADVRLPGGRVIEFNNLTGGQQFDVGVWATDAIARLLNLEPPKGKFVDYDKSTVRYEENLLKPLTSNSRVRTFRDVRALITDVEDLSLGLGIGFAQVGAKHVASAQVVDGACPNCREVAIYAPSNALDCSCSGCTWSGAPSQLDPIP